MSSELSVFQQGGIGLNLSTSKLFHLQPATISINQPNTQAEGAIKGKLRLTESGDQYDFLDLVIIAEPTERQDWFVGEPGTIYRTQENLMCFSTDLVKPDITARSPQALVCSSCKHNSQVQANWDKYRQTKNREDIPGCGRTMKVLFLDTNFRIPLKMYLRSKALSAFETGLLEFSRKLHIMKSQGLNPNIFDVAFRLTTKPSVTGKITNYVPFLSGFRAVTPEERAEYYTAYLQYSQAPLDPEAEAAEEINTTTQTIDNLAGAAAQITRIVDGEIVI